MNFGKYLVITLLFMFFLTGAVSTNASPVNYWDENIDNSLISKTIQSKQSNKIEYSLAPGDPVNFDAALQAGADYLRRLQADITEDNAGNGNPDVPDDPDDGGWDWTATTFSHTTSASPNNTYGATVMGVYYAYLESSDPALFTVLQDVADQLVATGPSINRSGADMKFLLLFNELYNAEVSITTVYADAAKAKYDGRIAVYGSATALAEAIRDFRAPSYPNGIIGWDIGIYAVVAQKLYGIYGTPYDTDADDIAEVLWQDSYNDNPGYFDIVDDAGWDPTYSNPNFYMYTLGLTGLIDAFNASGSHTAEIPDLVARLLASQTSGGGISYCYGANTDDEDWQSTGYAMMTLGNLNQAAYQTELNKMGYWLGATQDASGGWHYSGTYYTEVCGEATAGLYFTSNINSDVIVDDDFTSQAAVDIYNAANSTSYVWGFNAFATIQAAIDAVNGSTITILAGTYYETLNITTDGLNLIGVDRNTVIIDPTGLGTNNAGIYVDADNVTIQSLTLNSTVTTSLPRYGIKYGIVDGCVLDDVTVMEVYRSGVDALGTSNLTISNVTSQDNGGHGMSLTDCNGVDVSDVSFSNNGWQNVSVATWGRYSPLGTSDIVFSGTNSFGDLFQLEMGDYNNPGVAPAGDAIITYSTDILDGADVTVQSSDFGFALHGIQDDAPDQVRIWFFSTLTNAAVIPGLGAVGHWTGVGYYIEDLVDPTQLYVTPGGTIQAAIDAADPGDNINISAGTYTENINVHKYVTLVGAGSGTDPLSNTIITQNTAGAGDTRIGVVQLTASGLSSADPILFQDMRLDPDGMAGFSVGRFTEATGTNIAYIKIDNVFVVGNNVNPNTEQERGLYVDLTSTLDNLEVLNSAFDSLTYGWYLQKEVSADASTVSNVSVTNTTFNHNNHKGIYAEKLTEASFYNCTVSENGFTDVGMPSYFVPWMAGIDINLKAGTYTNLGFYDCTVTNNALGGAREGVGLTIKGRGTGNNPSASYTTYPAWVSNIIISGGDYTGNERGIRIGEPGKENASPTNVVINDANIYGNVQTYAGVDGSAYGDVINTLMPGISLNAELNYWGTISVLGVSDAVGGDVDFDPWCSDISHTNCTLTSLITEAWVDDDWVGTVIGTDLGSGKIFGYNAFATVQEGIDAVNGSTVYVAAGTYVVSAQLLINKDLNLIGEDKATTILTPGFNTTVGSYLVSDAFVYVDYGATVTIENLTIDGTGFTVRHAIQSRGADLTVRDCDIRDIYAGIYAGRGIVFLTGVGLVENCSMSNIQRIGVHIRGGIEPTAPDVDVIGLTYIGKGVGDFLDYGVEFGGGGTGTVQNSTISNCLGIASADGSTSAGILATDYYGTGTVATVTGCTITGNTTGIYSGYAAGDGTVLTANFNDLSGNTTGIMSVATTPPDATANWWGSSDATIVAGLNNGSINYSPWWGANYLGDPHTTAWTWGINNSGTIQSAIDAALAGDIINVATGVYAEGPQIHVDKSLSIIGEDPVTITPIANTGSAGDARGWFLVDAGVLLNFSNVTLDGSGYNIYQAVRSHGGGTYDNIIFQNITYPGYSGVGLAVFGNENVTISNSTFTNMGRIGALLYGSGLTDSYFLNNVYTGKGDGDWLDYAADISAGAIVTVDGCTITNCTGVASSDGSTSAALLVSTFYGLGTTASVTNSVLTGNTTGIAVGYDSADESIVNAHNNNISNNTSYGISTTGALVSVNAEDNYWGTFDGPLDTDGTMEAVIGGTCYATTDITNQVAEGFPGDGLGNPVGSAVDYCPWVATDVTMSPDDIVYLCDGGFDITVSISPSIVNMKSASIRISYPAGLEFGSMTLADANYSSAPTFTWDNAVGYDSVQVDMFVQSGLTDGFADLFTLTFSGTSDVCTQDMISITRAVWKAGVSNDEIVASTDAPLTITADCADPVVTINSPASGGFFNANPSLDILATDNCDIDYLYYQIDSDGWIEILSSFAGSSYADATWQMTTVEFDNLTEASHCVQFRIIDDLGREGLSSSWCFTKDITPPSAPSDFAAEPGHNKVKLSWTNSSSPDAIGIQIQRTPWGSYPTYNTSEPSYPPTENDGTNIFTGSGVSTIDLTGLNNATRDIYYYSAFAYDAAGNYSALTPAAQARSTSYWLGDIADNIFTLGNYDGFVHVGDLTVFATSYWKTSGDPGFVAEADFGPTVGGTDNGSPNSARGIPIPDDSISFTDLGLFAINYQSVDNVMKAVPFFTNNKIDGALNLSLEPSLEGDKVVCNFNLNNNADEAKVIHLAFDYTGNLEFESYTNHIADNIGGYPVFAKARNINNRVEFDIALMGQGATIGGSGTLASFTFNVVNEGETDFNFVEGLIYNNNLEELSSELVAGKLNLIPKSYSLNQNYPNPFNPTTEIAYEIPKSGKVTLEVFNLLGQRVVTLVDQEQEANSYIVTWNGKNSSGKQVTSGVYLYRLQVNNFVQTRKMMLLK